MGFIQRTRAECPEAPNSYAVGRAGPTVVLRTTPDQSKTGILQMTTQLQPINRLAAFAHRAAMLAILASLAACADDTEPTHLTAPSAASFGKKVPGSNQRLLFSSFRDGNQEVYSMNPDG